MNPRNDWTSGAFNTGGGKGDDDPSTPSFAHAPMKQLTEAKQKKQHHESLPEILNETGDELRPKEHMHDGNTCEDNEEIYAGLCYNKCDILTDGLYPIRTTAFSCCRSHPCGLTNQKLVSEAPCHGYDVNGDGGCPHRPGACLTDEEMFLGLCYGKCSLLTNGTFNNRAGPATCCKEKGELNCLNPFSGNSKLSVFFDVAGGKGDNSSATPGRVHGPLEIVTEEV